MANNKGVRTSADSIKAQEAFALRRVLAWCDYIPGIDIDDNQRHRRNSIRYWVERLVQARNGRLY